MCVSPAIPGASGPPPAPTHIHIIAGPHVVGDDELGGEFGHETRRPIFPHHEDVLLGVRGEPGEVFNFLLGGQASRGVCGHSGAEAPAALPLTLKTSPATPDPAGASYTIATGRPCRDRAGGEDVAAGGCDAGPVPCQSQRLPRRDRAPCRDSPTKYSRKMKSSPGRSLPAILPARSRCGRGCSSERSAPEKRKKKLKIKRRWGGKAAHLLSQEPHRLQKHSAAEWRGGGTGKVCGCAGRRRSRRGDAGGADGAPTPRDGAYAQPGGEEGRRDSPLRRPAAAADARRDRAEPGWPRALPAALAGPGSPRTGAAPPVPAGQAGGMEKGMLIPVPPAHGASLISVEANSCSTC